MNALPLLWLSIFFILGLFPAYFLVLPIPILVGLLTIGCLLVIVEKSIGKRWVIFRERSHISPLAWGFLWIAFCVGLIRQQTSIIPLSRDQVGWYNGMGKVSMTGIVSEAPTKSERFTQVRINVQRLDLPNGQEVNPIRGKVLLWLSKDSRVEYGDQLQLQGKLIIPFEDAQFSYKEYLAQQGINSLVLYPDYAVIRQNAGNPILSALYKIRETSDETLHQILPMPEAAVSSGILLGLQDNIPEELYQSYQASGTAHILVISGFNIAIISAMISRFFRRILPYGWDAIASAAAIILYTLLVGAEPPVVRAAIMGILALPANLLGRRMINLNILTFTAAMMLFFSPNLMQDVSFQLTFLATLGIVLFSEPLNQFFDRYLFRKNSPEEGSASGKWVKEYLLVTVAAQIGVLPVLLSHFDYVSLVTLPANLLILPAQPLVMILAGVALFSGLIFPPLGNLVAKLAWLPLFYSDQIALWMGALPIAMMKISHNWAWLGWAVLLGLMIPAVRFHFQSFEKGQK